MKIAKWQECFRGRKRGPWQWHTDSLCGEEEPPLARWCPWSTLHSCTVLWIGQHVSKAPDFYWKQSLLAWGSVMHKSHHRILVFSTVQWSKVHTSQQFEKAVWGSMYGITYVIKFSLSIKSLLIDIYWGLRSLGFGLCHTPGFLFQLCFCCLVTPSKLPNLSFLIG